MVFKFSISEKERLPTRRGMLSIISSVCDPMGFASPFTFKVKIILQSLCQVHVSWVEEIVGSDLSNWKEWLEELP